MKPTTLPASVLLAALLPIADASAADLAAGKAKADTVCAACHGANGVSVADHIPNLAAQRASYLSSQLAALKAGTRKSEIMNVIAPQLSEADMANIAAHYASLPGATGDAKSAFLPNLAKTSVSFPANFKTGFTADTGFTLYHTINDAENKQVKLHFANQIAIAAARAGKPLPDGSAVFVEIRAAKLDADKKPVAGSDGNLLPDKLLAYATMARGAGWGTDIPEIIRNENWNYAIFSADRQLRTGPNQAECLACHKPASKSSYVFTLEHMAKARN